MEIVSRPDIRSAEQARSYVAELRSVLQAIGAKHGRTAGQITLRWLLDKPRTVVIPKTASVERLVSNLDVVAIELDDVDRRQISALGKPSTRFFDPPWGPEWDES